MTFRFLLPSLCVAASLAGTPAPLDLWVATNGSDRAIGLDRRRPLASVEAAFARLRDLRAAGEPLGPTTIHVLPGLHFLERTLVLTPEDSGTGDAPVTLEGEGLAILSGGREARTPWKKEGGRWTATFPRRAQGTSIPSGLFFGETRAPRSRLPKGEDAFRGGAPSAEDLHAVGTSNALRWNGEDVPELSRLQDASLTIYHAWTASVHGLAKIDETRRLLLPDRTSRYPFGKWGPPRFFLENAREFTTLPGEWFLDGDEGRVEILPSPESDPTRERAVLSFLPRLVDIRGVPGEGRFVRHLRFRNLSFRHADAAFTNGEIVDGQAFATVKRAFVFARGLRDASFVGCEFAHGEAHGLWLEAGCQRVEVARNHLWDLGGGGIYVGDIQTPTNELLVTRDVGISNNFIHRVGLRMRGSHGVWVGRASENRIVHNRIQDLSYSPIAVGWNWGFKEPSGCSSNVIERNLLKDFGLGLLSDLAGIYTLGVQHGTRIRFNRIENAHSWSYGGWGLYSDEGSSHILLEKNLVTGTKSGGYHQHFGSNNLVRNNVFAFAGEANVISKRGDEMNRSLRFERNVVLTSNAWAVNTGFSRPSFRMASNLYWDLGPEPASNLSFNGLSFADWKEASGYEGGSVLADPRFVDPLRGDFRLADEGPVRSIGFEPFLEEIAKAGLTGDEEWTRLPERFPSRPNRTDVLPPATRFAVGSRTRLEESFDSVAPGTPSPVGKGDEGVRVAAGRARHGTHSLRFQDDPALAKDWMPALFIERSFKDGEIRLSFALSFEEGCPVFIEGRKAGRNSYLVGPSLRIEASGDLRIEGRVVARLAPDTWTRFEIVWNQAKGSGTRDWTLELTEEGGRTERLEGLGIRSPGFDVLDTLLFSAAGRTDKSFWIDDLLLEVK